ncbi:hypothetical protein BT93_L2152 [Corymbia citriodora subsp. variegata]|uniref:Uncharacterized protein n=1 Tax=Corymbia citriodora subsp. variegata TaxID=360336 RepID=A0A8T0CQU8_CORYI|nr:hypothetical protein BT93_L2152 [Corymbia citriodora subsp. variegata]
MSTKRLRQSLVTARTSFIFALWMSKRYVNVLSHRMRVSSRGPAHHVKRGRSFGRFALSLSPISEQKVSTPTEPHSPLPFRLPDGYTYGCAFMNGCPYMH